MNANYSAALDIRVMRNGRVEQGFIQSFTVSNISQQKLSVRLVFKNKI